MSIKPTLEITFNNDCEDFKDKVVDLGIEDVDYTVDESTGRKYKLYPEINKNKKEDEE